MNTNQENFKWAVDKLTFEGNDRNGVEALVTDLIDRYGEIVDEYPSWHPLIRNHDAMTFVTYPSEECGYVGLDHMVCFANAFISIPYNYVKMPDVLAAVSELPSALEYPIWCEELTDIPLYNYGTTPYLVCCDWNLYHPIVDSKTAIGLFLSHEMKSYGRANRAEPWSSMRDCVIGKPSSAFITKQTERNMKSIWNHIIKTGIFGEIKS